MTKKIHPTPGAENPRDRNTRNGHMFLYENLPEPLLPNLVTVFQKKKKCVLTMRSVWNFGAEIPWPLLLWSRALLSQPRQLWAQLSAWHLSAGTSGAWDCKGKWWINQSGFRSGSRCIDHHFRMSSAFFTGGILTQHWQIPTLVLRAVSACSCQHNLLRSSITQQQFPNANFQTKHNKLQTFYSSHRGVI